MQKKLIILTESDIQKRNMFLLLFEGLLEDVKLNQECLIEYEKNLIKFHTELTAEAENFIFPDGPEKKDMGFLMKNITNNPLLLKFILKDSEIATEEFITFLINEFPAALSAIYMIEKSGQFDHPGLTSNKNFMCKIIEEQATFARYLSAELKKDREFIRYLAGVNELILFFKDLHVHFSPEEIEGLKITHVKVAWEVRGGKPN